MNDLEKDEISFVQIAVTLVKRKYWLITLFAISFAITILFAFYQKKVLSNPIKLVKYSSFFSSGYMAPGYTLEPLGSTEIAIREIYAQEANGKYAIDIEHDYLKMGNMIRMTTTIPAEEENEKTAKEIQDLHSNILKSVLEQHENLFNTVREINQNGSKVGYSASTHSNIVALAQRTAFNQSSSKFTPTKVLIIGFLLSLMIGVMGVFILEFLFQVKTSMDISTK